MREKLIYVLAAVASLLLARNLAMIFLHLPDEASQGMIYRIIFFHVPAWWTAMLGAIVALVASVLFLVKKDFRHDSLAVAATEAGLAFLTIGLVTGTIWARIIWGIWWTWDARLTSALICWILYGGYLILRRTVDEPTQRATLAAVYSIFAFVDVPIVWFSIRWWRTQHPQPVFGQGGFLEAGMKSTLLWNFLAVGLIGVILLLIRLQQEENLREIDALRRETHAIS